MNCRPSPDAFRASQFPFRYVQSGRTALLHAAEEGKFEAVEKLVSLGADVDHADEVSWLVTPLFRRPRALRKRTRHAWTGNGKQDWDEIHV